MTQHLSPELIDRYRGRRLTPAEILAFGAHLATCEACREQFAVRLPTRAVVEALRAELATASAEPRHLVAEELDRLVDGTLEDVDREVAQSHLAMCPACTAEVSDLRAFRSELRSRPLDAPPSPVLTGLSQRPRYAALAAGLLLAVGLGVVHQMSMAPGYRERETAGIKSLVPEGVSLSRSQCLLRWQGPPEAMYELRVSSADLRAVDIKAGLKSGEYRVPEEFLARLPSGAKLLWQVTARLPDGTVVAGSTFIAVGCQ